MLSQSQISMVSELVSKLTNISNSKFKYTNKDVLDVPTISYDLRGKTAGTANITHNIVTFNKILIEENFQQFISDTIPHEVAHIVTSHFFGRQRRPHGDQWKYVMKHVYHVNPKRCHNLDTTNSISRHYQRYEYSCKCQTVHNLTKIRHNRIIKGTAGYHCKICNTYLKFTGNMMTPATLEAQKKDK